MKYMKKIMVVVASAALATGAFAGAHKSGEMDMDKMMAKMKALGQYSGLEGEEQALGEAVAAAIASQGAAGDERYNFEGREEDLGRAVSNVVKTMNHNDSYQHLQNDALVKMTLGHIQFAKDNDMMAQAVEQDLRVTYPMMSRVGKMIEMTGDKELALTAMFDQTTCFYQLVDERDRTDGKVVYKAPFNELLEITNKMGQYDLTAEEIHEQWTKPRYQGYAKILGVDLIVSDIDEDGNITVQIAPTS